MPEPLTLVTNVTCDAKPRLYMRASLLSRWIQLCRDSCNLVVSVAFHVYVGSSQADTGLD